MATNKTLKKSFSIIIVFIMLVSTFINNGNVFAEDTGRNLDKVSITRFEIKNENGGAMPPGSVYGYWSKYRLDMDWDASYYGDQLKEGDYFIINLPKQFKFPTDGPSIDFDLFTKDKQNVIAKAHVNSNGGAGGGNIKVTFTNYVENKPAIKGDLYIEARFAHQHITEGTVNTISIEVGGVVTSIDIEISEKPALQGEYFTKWAEKPGADDTKVLWNIRLNHKKANYTNLIIKDRLYAKTGDLPVEIKYIPDSFQLKEVELDKYGALISVKKTYDYDALKAFITFSENKTSFEFKFHDMLGPIAGRQYVLKYESTYVPQLVLRNEAVFKSDEITTPVNSYFLNSQAGGGGQSDLRGRIVIVKVDADNTQIKLKDAEFTVTSVADGTQYILKTNTKGEAISEKLPAGKYKIKETKAPDGGYVADGTEKEIDVLDDEATYLVVKNTKNIDITIKAVKRWETNGFIGNKKTLYFCLANGNNLLLDSKKKVEEDSNQVQWTVPKRDNMGNEIDYKVVELDENNNPWTENTNWKSETVGDLAGGFTITNTYKNPKIDIKVEKIWKNITGDKPEIQVQLMKNEKPEGSPVTLGNGAMEYTWKALDELDNLGNKYVYTVKEVGEQNGHIKIDNIWYKVETSGTSDAGFKITNTKLNPWTPMIPPTRDLKVKKIWNLSNQTAAPVDEVEVELYKDGHNTGKTLKLTAADGWQGTFSGLPVSETLGGPVHNYAVREKGEVQGKILFGNKWFNVTYKGTMADGLTVTNGENNSPITPTYPQYTRDIKVSKTWEISGETKPVDKIEVELYKNGQPTGNRLSLNQSNNWSGVFSRLPIYQYAGGPMYEYTVKEVGETQNSINFNGKEFKVFYGGTMQEGFLINNKEIKANDPQEKPDSTRDIKVVKRWNSYLNQYVKTDVKQIKIELYVNGKATGNVLVLNAGNDWTGAFKGLDVYEKAGGRTYKYTVKEVGEQNNKIELNGSIYKVMYTGNMDKGYTIINMKEVKGTRTVPKTEDRLNTPLYVALLAITGLGILFLGFKKKKVK